MASAKDLIDRQVGNMEESMPNLSGMANALSAALNSSFDAESIGTRFGNDYLQAGVDMPSLREFSRGLSKAVKG
jgi:hypothetical protein